MATFAELFCQHHRIPPEKYGREMFWRCLHKRAWFFLPIISVLPDEFFAADRELIREVGQLHHTRGLSDALADYYSHPNNLTFARRRLRLRISGRRVSRLVYRVMGHRAEARVHDVDTRFAS